MTSEDTSNEGTHDALTSDDPPVTTRPFGVQVREYRENRLNLTQGELALQAKISENIVSEIETHVLRHRRAATFNGLLAVIRPVLNEEEKKAFRTAWRVLQRTASHADAAPESSRDDSRARRAEEETLRQLLTKLRPDARLVDRQRLRHLVQHGKQRVARVIELERQVQALRAKAETAAARCAVLEGQCRTLGAACATLTDQLSQCDEVNADLARQNLDLSQEADYLRQRNNQLEAAVGRLSSLVGSGSNSVPTMHRQAGSAAARALLHESASWSAASTTTTAVATASAAYAVNDDTVSDDSWSPGPVPGDLWYLGLALVSVLVLSAYPLLAAEPSGWLYLTVGGLWAPPSQWGAVASLYTGDLRILWSIGLLGLASCLGFMVINALHTSNRTRVALGTLGLVGAAGTLLLSYLLPDIILWMWETGVAIGLLATTTLGLLLSDLLKRHHDRQHPHPQPYLHPLPLTLLLLYIGAVGAAIAIGLVPLTDDGQGLSVAGVAGAMVLTLMGLWLRLRILVRVGRLGLLAQAIIYSTVLHFDHIVGYPISTYTIAIVFVCLASTLAGYGAGLLGRLVDPVPEADGEAAPVAPAASYPR